MIWRPLPEVIARRRQRDDEVDDLIGLLIEHGHAGAGSPADIALVAETVALACLGDNHLWQELQLPSRGVQRLCEVLRAGGRACQRLKYRMKSRDRTRPI